MPLTNTDNVAGRRAAVRDRRPLYPDAARPHRTAVRHTTSTTCARRFRSDDLAGTQGCDQNNPSEARWR
jgi:hypothetical protein